MNIAEILKDAPIGAYTNGIKLYSPMFGDVELMNILDDGQMEVSEKDGTIWRFKSDGCFPYGGEIMLFPSKENRDWSTFKVELQFPINLEGCRKEFGYIDDYTSSDYCLEKISAFQNLILCRDAWWKVDGNWKPDWSKSDKKYIIVNNGNEINVDGQLIDYNTVHVLAFRTKEIRDKFLETFRDLIKQCKELI